MKITVIKGDITTIEAEVIVNAANSSLLGGGGVDGAIHRAGGRTILDECIAIRNTIGRCETGQVVKTGAGNLKARYVFHTVGPVWQGGAQEERVLLGLCYERAIDLALRLGCSRIAFPNISTGVYGFPKEEAVQVVKEAIRKRLGKNEAIEVVFVNYDEENYTLYRDAFAFP